MNEVSTTHPFRAYLADLPDAWRVVRSDLAEARRSARYLWPLMWRATSDADVERAEEQGFEMGQERERYLAAERKAAPSVGRLFRTVREAKGLTLAEVAPKVDIDPERLEPIEAGEEIAPRGLQRRLSQTLGAWLTVSTA